jgi:hypothetical protein
VKENSGSSFLGNIIPEACAASHPFRRFHVFFRLLPYLHTTRGVGEAVIVGVGGFGLNGRSGWTVAGFVADFGFVGGVVVGFTGLGFICFKRAWVAGKALMRRPAQRDRTIRQQQSFPHLDVVGECSVSHGSIYSTHHGKRRWSRERPAASCCIVVLGHHGFKRGGHARVSSMPHRRRHSFSTVGRSCLGVNSRQDLLSAA